MLEYCDLPYEIIDAHIHPAIMVEKSDISLFNFTNPPEQLVSTLRRAGISRAAGSVVRRFTEPPQWEDIHQLNLAALEMQRCFPDFYIPGIHIHPDFPEQSLAELESMWEDASLGMGKGIVFAAVPGEIVEAFVCQYDLGDAAFRYWDRICLPCTEDPHTAIKKRLCKILDRTCSVKYTFQLG